MAAELGMTVARMHEEMDCVELARWALFFENRARREKDEMNKARRR